MTIEIQTFVPSAKATTSANVFHRLSVVSSATELRLYNVAAQRARAAGGKAS